MKKTIDYLKIFLWSILISCFIIGIIALVIGVYNYISVYIEFLGTSDAIELQGIGDNIKSSTTFFTIALICATVITVLMQYESNKLHKTEFDNDRNDKKKEYFENHFFQLLGIYENIVSKLSYKNKEDYTFVELNERKLQGKTKRTHNVIYHNREVFFKIYGILKILIGNNHRGTLKESKNLLETFREKYKEFYSDNQEYLGHYFRTIYHIIKLIDDNNDILSKDEKLFYSGILRAQLSTYELLLLYYNCLSKPGEEMWKYSRWYDLTKHLEKSFLIDIKKDELWDIYVSEYKPIV